MNFPGVDLEVPSLTKNDKKNIILGKKLNIDVSVVRDCLGIKDYYDFELDQEL